MDSTGKTDKLPDGLIDRAVEAIEWTCNCDRADLDLHLAVRRCAPPLIAYGREQEKARWEARIEKQAAWEDRARAEQSKVARWFEESGSKMAEIRQDEYRHAYTGRVLRSLRTGEGDGE